MASTRAGTSATDADITDQPVDESTTGSTGPNGRPDQVDSSNGTDVTGVDGTPDATVTDLPVVADTPAGDDAPDAAGTVEADEAAPSPVRIPPHLLEMPGPANPSPSGSDTAYFQRSATGGWDLVFCPLDGSPAEIIELPVTLKPTIGPDGDLSASTGPVWSPNGHFLALTCVHPETGRDAIWLLDLQTGLFRPLVSHAADDRSPRWSPDNRVVAFTSTVNGRDRVAIAEATPPEGITPYAIYLTDGLQDDRDPAWLRDGLEVVFRRRLPEVTTDNLYIVSIVTGELRQVTGREGRVGLGSQPAYRHSPITSPDKPQVAYATNEKDWDLIAIANSENGTGWTLAGEAGDKADPQWAPDGKKVAYTRTIGTVTNVCTKGTAAAVTDILDPGTGVARHPRWLADGRIVYWYMDSVRAPRLILQAAGPKLPRTVLSGPATPIDPNVPAPASSEPTGEDARVESADPGAEPIPAAASGSTESTDDVTPAVGAMAPTAAPAGETPADSGTAMKPKLAAATAPKPEMAATATTTADEITGEQVRASIAPISPDFVTPTVIEVATADRLKIPGLLYRPASSVESIGVLSVGQGPPHRIAQEPDLAVQALVAGGYPVFLANLRGTPGLGRGTLTGLADLADFEAETDDIATSLRVLRGHEDGLPDQVAIMGRGFGGSLALTGAGGRPGQFAAVIAIDPITDWDRAFDEFSPTERAWYQRTFGLPIVEGGRYALRTPSTFAGVIDAPILLITTSDAAAANLAPLTDTLADLDVGYEHRDLSDHESDSEIGEAIAAFLQRVGHG